MSVSCHASAPEREGPCLQQEEASGSFPFFFSHQRAVLYFRWSLRWSGWVLGFRTISLNVAACKSFLGPRNQYMHVFMFALFVFHRWVHYSSTKRDW